MTRTGSTRAGWLSGNSTAGATAVGMTGAGTILGADHGAFAIGFGVSASRTKPATGSGAEAATDSAATRAADRCLSSRINRHAATLITSATASETTVITKRMMSISSSSARPNSLSEA